MAVCSVVSLACKASSGVEYEYEGLSVRLEGTVLKSRITTTVTQ